jgi:hypothetical protein
LEKQRKNFFDGSSKSGDSDIVNIVIGSNVNDIANIIKEDFSDTIVNHNTFIDGNFNDSKSVGINNIISNNGIFSDSTINGNFNGVNSRIIGNSNSLVDHQVKGSNRVDNETSTRIIVLIVKDSGDDIKNRDNGRVFCSCIKEIIVTERNYPATY